MADPKKPFTATDILPPATVPGARRSKSSAPPSPRGDAWRAGHTLRMPAAPPLPSVVLGEAQEHEHEHEREIATPADEHSGIELLIVQDDQRSTGGRRAWRAAEVWTKRRIYGLDSTFKCFEIIDRETGKPELGNELLGARLGGGRARDATGVRFAYPYPTKGMEAMFVKDKKHGYTSGVERMVIRVRVMRTTSDQSPPSWEEIAGRWSERPPRG